MVGAGGESVSETSSLEDKWPIDQWRILTAVWNMLGSDLPTRRKGKGNFLENRNSQGRSGILIS